MPINGNVQVQRSVLPEGIAGVDATVRKMVEIAHSVYGSKSARIRALAIDIVRNAGVKDKDYYGEMVAIHNWVRDNIRYVRDPLGQETLSYPEETVFNSRAGDCDDMSIVEMALLGAVGIESYPVVVGMFPGHFSHVYIYGKVPAGKGRNAGRIIPLDPIMKEWDAGREAQKVKAKKAYPNLSNPLTMNGLPMGSQQDVGDLGAYTAGPSYLDREDSHAGLLVIPDQQRSNVHNDKTVANASRVNMPFEGIDGMFGGPVVRDTGDNFTGTSAGDGGTIVESGGQLVPKGFIRREADLNEVMRMHPATAAELGPRGPIFARRAKDEHERLHEAPPARVASLAREMRNDKTVQVKEIQQIVGGKRYSLPSAQQSLRQQRGLTANPVRNLPKKQIVVLNSISLDRLGAPAKPLPTLGEELAGAETELAGLKYGLWQARQQAGIPQPMAMREGWLKQAASLAAQQNAMEQKVLTLRQEQRAAPGAPHPAWAKVRATQIQNTAPARGWRRRPIAVNGLGEGFMDIIKKPIVWGPVVAFIGVFALRMYLKKRRAAAATA